jgi:hypothetical protein
MTVAGGTRSSDREGKPGMFAFPLLAGENTIPIRIMTDTRSVEIFVANGRGVYSGPLHVAYVDNKSGEPSVFFSIVCVPEYLHSLQLKTKCFFFLNLGVVVVGFSHC